MKINLQLAVVDVVEHQVHVHVAVDIADIVVEYVHGAFYIIKTFN